MTNALPATAVPQRIRRYENIETPWGPSQHADIYAEGVIFYETASHGGFHLDAERNAKIDARWRSTDGWYEEDVEWAIVAYTFPDLFSDKDRGAAYTALIHYYPDEYEAITGRQIEPGLSFAREERLFVAKHAADFVVASAIFSKHEPGFVEVFARRKSDKREKRFLVPAAEYENRSRHGFIIDLARHRQYDGPSSFLGLAIR